MYRTVKHKSKVVFFFRSLLELVTRKPVFWVATGSVINRAVQPPGTATEDGLKLEISNKVLRISCIILLLHSLGHTYNYLGRNGIVSSCVYVA